MTTLIETPKIKTVLILGANGRLGRAATMAFQKAGWIVRAQIRSTSTLDPILSALPFPVDIDDFQELKNAASGCDIIINALNPSSYDKWEQEFPAITTGALHAAKSSGAPIILAGNVYNFGKKMPNSLTGKTIQNAQTKKGRLRISMENQYLNAIHENIKTIVVHMGDFLENRSTGNWFDTHLTAKLDKGIFLYPGPTDIPHAWTYLPDAGRALVEIAENHSSLSNFTNLTMPGTNVSGEQICEQLERTMGRPIDLKPFPWWMLRLISPFNSNIRELFELRYLWNIPHGLNGAEFLKIAPDFTQTPLNQIIDNIVKNRKSAIS